MRAQFNTRISKGNINRVRKDASSRNQTNDVIVDVALDHFFSAYTAEQRASFYRAHNWTTKGTK